MVSLNDYLYSGDTVLRILQKYYQDLKKEAEHSGNEIDRIHCDFLLQIEEILEHNEFLTAQSQKIREFYMYMAKKYPFLAFTFKGRIKSLIRAENKFNGYIVEYIHSYYQKNNTIPDVSELKEKLQIFRDLIAYRIVISVPKCHLKAGEDKKNREIAYLYEIANDLPGFLEKQGFVPKSGEGILTSTSELLNDDVRGYYRDYICHEEEDQYQSLHITFFDSSANCHMEVQLRTKEMDDCAEIGPANHIGYEKHQEHRRRKRGDIPEGLCVYFDDAYERVTKLQELSLAEIDVNMFAAYNNNLINDGCGLYRGRGILPYEHLSRFQNDSFV